MHVDLGTLTRVDPGQFGAVGGRDRRADRAVALSYTDVVTQTACWEERSQVCDEIRLALAEVRRRTPSAEPAWGPRGTTPRLTVRGTAAGAPPPPPPPPHTPCTCIQCTPQCPHTMHMHTMHPAVPTHHAHAYNAPHSAHTPCTCIQCTPQCPHTMHMHTMHPALSTLWYAIGLLPSTRTSHLHLPHGHATLWWSTEKVCRMLTHTVSPKESHPCATWS